MPPPSPLVPPPPPPPEQAAIKTTVQAPMVIKRRDLDISSKLIVYRRILTLLALVLYLILTNYPRTIEHNDLRL